MTDNKAYIINESISEQPSNPDQDTTNNEPPPSYGFVIGQENVEANNNSNRPNGQIQDDSEDSHLSWCEKQQKYKPQSNSISAGLLLLCISGLHIGWGIYRVPVMGIWIIGIEPAAYTFAIIIFHMSANLGGFIGSKLVVCMNKTFIYYIGATLYALSSVLFLFGSRELGAIMTGRILAGLAHGIVYLTTIIHGSENAVKEIRGLILASIDYAMVWSIFIMTLLNFIRYYQHTFFNLDSLIGLVGLIFALLAICMTPCYTYESVIYSIKLGKDDLAIRDMMKLRTESIETRSIRADYEEIKVMIDEDNHENNNRLCTIGNGRAFFIVAIAKIISSLATSFAIHFCLIFFMIAFNFHTNTGMIMILPRVGFAIIPIFLSDSVGRRVLMLTSGWCSGVCLIVLGILAATLTGTYYNLIILAAFGLGLQAFIGLGIGSVPDILLSEAFSTTTKANSIRLIILIEQTIQIIPIAVTYNILLTDVYFYVVLFLFGGLILFLTTILHFLMPETKNLSLRQTRDAFRGKTN